MEAARSPQTMPTDARRLAACVIGAEDTRGLALEAVSSLEIQLLKRGWPVGEPLGALLHVQKVMGLGRPAYREALAILESRGLLSIRRGPGGGLFVSAPALEDVVAAMLMYLVVTGADEECIRDFRTLVWRMVVQTAIERGVRHLPAPAARSEWGFAHDLAVKVGNRAMIVAAQLAETLVTVCEGPRTPAYDEVLDDALRACDFERACARLDALVDEAALAEPALALEKIERGLFWSGHKSAMALAARMTRELRENRGAAEAEWQTAERFGCTHAGVRQARRILQDLGIVRCQQGRKGAIWTTPASPAGVIRLLAPCLLASGMTTADNAAAAFFLASSAPELAARRAKARGAAHVTLLAPLVQGTNLVDLFWAENMMLELGGNPLLTIMVRSLGLANMVGDPVAPDRATQIKITAFNRQILHAVECGDVEAAGELARAKGGVLNHLAA